MAVRSKDYLGIIDMADLTSFVLKKGLKFKRKEGGVLVKLSNVFKKASTEHDLEKAVDQSTSQRFCVLSANRSLYEVR